MKVIMTYGDVEKVLNIFKKIAETVDVIARWEMAKRINVLRDVMDPVDKAREIPVALKKYNEKQESIFEEFGTPIQNKQGIGYQIDNWGPVNEKLKELRNENSEVLKASKNRKKDIELLLSKEVEIDILPIDYEWCGNNVSGVEIADLMLFSLIKEPKSLNEVIKNTGSNKNKKRV